MIKKEMIVEMAKVMAENWFTETIISTAERLINAGYRKIPEGSVVLSKEEYEKLCHLAYFGYEDVKEQGRKETAKEILSLAIKHDNGYETDMTRFISDLEKQYGVEE